MNRRVVRIAAAHGFTLAVLAAWTLAAQRVPSYLLPGPYEVALRVADFAAEWRLARHMFISFGHVGGAIAISFVIGSGLALLAYYFPVFNLAVHRRIGPFLNSFSGVGWTLLAVIWFGIAHKTVIFAISAVLVPFALINISAGLANIDRELLEMSDSFTRRRVRQFFAVLAPALFPFMFATLRIMFGVSWKVALTAELFGGSAGLGYLINLARQEFDTATIFAAIVLIIAFVYGSDRLVFAPVQARVSRHYGQS
ncbi:MAG: ABC transporter permease subunit [Rhodospirillales bacterium]|nr:ABC transporter permease subunit [Rhodospirillales bacterium]